ncbi:hypothetical protein DFP72DRAFT_1174306 [Ephemerocybe angulata]|uniref:Uncharacterized protein n=1 Tax=Ephemerocybe angulata TaxID=980116 RepID=A0A8H6HLH5_9AGAR|nr:hypothetical protein DFP72DRAFT_1174306 [Tulosesus angulatus]
MKAPKLTKFPRREWNLRVSLHSSRTTIVSLLPTSDILLSEIHGQSRLNSLVSPILISVPQTPPPSRQQETVSPQPGPSSMPDVSQPSSPSRRPRMYTPRPPSPLLNFNPHPLPPLEPSPVISSPTRPRYASQTPMLEPSPVISSPTRPRYTSQTPAPRIHLAIQEPHPRYLTRSPTPRSPTRPAPDFSHWDRPRHIAHPKALPGLPEEEELMEVSEEGELMEVEASEEGESMDVSLSEERPFATAPKDEPIEALASAHQPEHSICAPVSEGAQSALRRPRVSGVHRVAGPSNLLSQAEHHQASTRASTSPSPDSNEPIGALASAHQPEPSIQPQTIRAPVSQTGQSALRRPRVSGVHRVAGPSNLLSQAEHHQASTRASTSPSPDSNEPIGALASAHQPEPSIQPQTIRAPVSQTGQSALRRPRVSGVHRVAGSSNLRSQAGHHRAPTLVATSPSLESNKPIGALASALQPEPSIRPRAIRAPVSQGAHAQSGLRRPGTSNVHRVAGPSNVRSNAGHHQAPTVASTFQDDNPSPESLEARLIYNSPHVRAFRGGSSHQNYMWFASQSMESLDFPPPAPPNIPIPPGCLYIHTDTVSDYQQIWLMPFVNGEWVPFKVGDHFAFRHGTYVFSNSRGPSWALRSSVRDIKKRKEKSIARTTT